MAYTACLHKFPYSFKKGKRPRLCSHKTSVHFSSKTHRSVCSHHNGNNIHHKFHIGNGDTASERTLKWGWKRFDVSLLWAEVCHLFIRRSPYIKNKLWLILSVHKESVCVSVSKGMKGGPVGHFLLFTLTRWQRSWKISCILKSIFPTEGH